MRTIRSLIPILILMGISVYSWRYYAQAPEALVNVALYVPILLALMVAGLAFHFNRSPVFFYMLLVCIAYVVLWQGWAGTELRYSLLTGSLPLLLLTFTVLPERGILSLRAIPSYVVLLFCIGFSFWVSTKAPAWATHYLLTDWLPARYFDWSSLPQTVLAVTIFVFLCMLVLNFVRPSTHLAAGIGVLVMLVVQAQLGDSSRSLVVFSSAALLMCLYAVVQESWRMAYLDELTGLPGRRALREKFQKMGGLYSVAMLDVDHFKKFNDTYGHDTGDAVLRKIAAQMQKVTGSGVSYRYGGEEFTVVFPDKDRDEVRPHMDALREAIAKSPFVLNRHDRRKKTKGRKRRGQKKVRVTVSIGVSDSSRDSSSPWEIVKFADKALYKAKKKGRNCVCH